MRPADLARLTLLGAIWGSSFVLIKVALEGLTPLQIVGGRIAVAAVVLTIVVKARNLRLPAGGDVWRGLAVVACVSNIVPFFLIAWGEERITSGMTAILNSTTPLFTALLASFFLAGERLTSMRAAGIAVGFIGVATIVGSDIGGGVTGQLAALAAAASYGAGFVYVRKRLSGKGTAPVALSAGQMLLGGGFIVLPTAVDLAVAPPGPLLAPALAVVVLGAVGTGFAYIIYYRLIEDIGATSASFVTYLIPLFGVVLGYVFLGERLGWNTFAGALLIIAGISIAERGARRSRTQTLEPAEVPDDEPVVAPRG